MWDGRIAQAEKGGLDSLAEANVQRWFSPKFHQERSTDLKGFVSMFTRTPLEGYIGTAIAIRDADFREDAALITVPTKCVVGDQDGATTPEMVKNTADMIPNAQFEIIKKCWTYTLCRKSG